MNQPHPLVYIARHGTTELNSKDAFRGPIDVPLDAKGRRDANKLKAYFEDMDFSYAFSSGMDRTKTTAKKILEGHNLEAVPNENLNALNVGYLAGQEKSPENLAAIEYYVHNPDIPIPDGESLHNFQGRVRPLILDAVQLAIDSGTPVLLVVHSSVIHEVGVMIGGHHEYTLVEPGGVACIYIKNGQLDAEPIFKPKPQPQRQRGESIT